jgi:hypothetical protein
MLLFSSNQYIYLFIYIFMYIEIEIFTKSSNDSKNVKIES